MMCLFLLLILWDLIGTRSKRARIIKLKENQGSPRRCLKALKSSKTKKSTNKPKKKKQQNQEAPTTKITRTIKAGNALMNKRVRTIEPKTVPMSKGTRTTKLSLKH
jgi:hypothetical protein